MAWQRYCSLVKGSKQGQPGEVKRKGVVPITSLELARSPARGRKDRPRKRWNEGHVETEKRMHRA
jgi:hypothetical protein